MVPKFIEKSKIPRKSGIYIFKDGKGKILYVGKAIDLYHRVVSYFSGEKFGKTAVLVSQIRSMETTVVQSELEALILEANLIKKYLPPFNIRLTDDKDYLYIAVTREDFPKIITARRKDLKQVKLYFGPFPSSKTVKTTLKQLRKVFPWCSNPPKKYLQSWKTKACFYYHLDLCPGACIGRISKQDYAKIIKRFSKFMSGQKQELIRELTTEMKGLAKDMRFEDAQKIKKIILGINYLTQQNRVSKYLENPNFLEQENLRAVNDLQLDLKLPKLPERIEGYDISNISGKDATGSMVVLIHGEIDRSQYRRFKIRMTGKPNDVGMHKEMMKRRLNHPEWGIPDLILVDGGRGQVSGAHSELQSKNFNTPIFGLAKRMEWLYSPEREVIKLPKRSLSLRLLQKIRDESHRFAIEYHRKLRKKSFGV